jgi:hypothetical protein
MSDADCKGGPITPGINKCSSDVLFSVGELFPTPVCMMPTQCDPCGGVTPCDGLIHYCDGPDAPSSPGLCLPSTNPPAVGMGTCWPKCSFVGDGNVPMGCVGRDACYVAGYGVNGTTPVGLGYCLGGCTSDVDCSVGSEKCDTSTGLCVKTVTPPTKALGAGCTMAEAQANPPPCNCIYNTQSGLGFCTKFCIVLPAGQPGACPAGWFCEAQEPLTLAGANDASVTGFPTQNLHLAGYCAPSCQVGTTVCPANSTCQTGYAGGPGCLP